MENEMEEFQENLDKKNKPKIRYIKIDYDILFDEELSNTAKYLFPIIELFDNTDRGCFASNEYLAALLNCSARNISRAIGELKERKYIETDLIKGRFRNIKIIDDGSRKEKISKAINDQEQRIRDFFEKNDTTRLSRVHRQDCPGCIDKNGDILLIVDNKECKINSSSFSSYEENSKREAQEPCLLPENNFSRESCPNENEPLNQTESIPAKTSVKATLDRSKFKTKKKGKHPLDAEAERLVDLWKGFGFRITGTRKDKAAILEILDGSLFSNKSILDEVGLTAENSTFGAADIEKSISNFSLYCRSKPRMKNTSLKDFFYNHHNKKLKSSFVANLNSTFKPKETIEDLPEETDEEWPITSMIRGVFKSKVYHGADVDFSVNDEKNFRKARDFVIYFKTKHRKSLVGDALNTRYLSSALVESLIERNDGETSRVKSCFLVNKDKRDTEERLFKFLDSQGLIKNKATRDAGY
jgi:biotin operon repressor